MIRECVEAAALVYLTITAVQAWMVRTVTGECAAIAAVCIFMMAVFWQREESRALHVGEAVVLILAVGLIIAYGISGGIA
ncbi:MAG: hypothetical protein ACXQTN_01765 [Methanoculleaceae archaeon]